MSFFFLEANLFGRFDSASLETEAINPVRNAFMQNCIRISSLVSLPSLAAVTASDFYVAAMRAEFDLTRTVYNDPPLSLVTNEKYIKQFKAHMNHLATSPDAIKRYEAAEHNFNAVIDTQKNHFSSHIETVFKSMVIQGWTAFEVLAGDLWEVSLNAHPEILSNLSGNPKRWVTKPANPVESMESRKDKNTNDELKKVSIDSLHKHGFDLSKVMGTVLRDRFNFTKLRSIRDAYAEAFSKRDDKVKAALLDQGLDNIAAVRNCIVHRAGIADQEFVHKAANNEHFKAVKVGDPITLDGKVVQLLLKGMFDNSVALIAAVNEWIANRREPTSTDQTEDS